MKNWFKISAFTVMVLLGGLGISRAQNTYDTTKAGHNIKKVVLYDYAVTGGHAASRAVLRLSLQRMAAKYGFQLVMNNTSGYLNATVLANTQVLVLSNGDGDVIGSAAGAKAAVTNFVELDGHAVFMNHASGAFVPCPTLTSATAVSGGENIDGANCQFLARVAVRQYLNHDGTGTYSRIYVDSTVPGPVRNTGVAAKQNCASGGYGANIPLQTTTRSHGIMNDETKGIFKDNSGNLRFTRNWESLKDEWYTFRSATYWPVRSTEGRTYTGTIDGTTPYTIWEGPVNVLLSYDELGARGSSATNAAGSFNPTCPVTGDHPLAWTRKMGKGISAYNSIGHDAPTDGGIDIYAQKSDNSKTGTPEDSVVQAFTWNTMRYLAGDFTGCMNANYKEYNPEATVTLLTGKDSATYRDSVSKYPAYPCKIATTGINVIKDNSVSFGLGASHNTLQISINQSGIYHILVTDMRGKQVFSKTVSGGLNKKLEVPGLPLGTYFVRANSPKSGLIVKRVSIY